MATMRYNDLNYSGSVHKWVKQPVPVGAAAPQGQLHLPKWVRTGEVTERREGPRLPHLVPVGKPAWDAEEGARDMDAGPSGSLPTSQAAPPQQQHHQQQQQHPAAGGGDASAPSASQPYSLTETQTQTQTEGDAYTGGIDLTQDANGGGGGGGDEMDVDTEATT